MNKKRIFILLGVVVFILVLSGATLLIYLRKESSQLYGDLDLDSIIAFCLDKAPVENNPKTGIYKLQRFNSYADYFYRAHLKSVEKVKINDCDFVKLGLVYEPTALNFPFNLYIPEKLPSPGVSKTILPEEMSNFLNKRVEIKVRYGTDNTSDNPDHINKILDWQFLVVYTN